MAVFEVHGPFEIQYEKRGGGRSLCYDGFWDGPAAELASERGCYVFAVRSGPSEMPIYVGKATKTFKQETFTPANQIKYHNGFSEYAKATPVMYLVAHPKQRGKTNASQIAEIEGYLIQAGVARNEYLQNVRGIDRPAWKIAGVVRSGKGRRSHAAVSFASLMGITPRTRQ
jgi:hypothetical protein